MAGGYPEPLTHFTITASPGSQPVPPTGSADYTVTVVPANGFNQAVTLSASDLPANVMAVFNPSSMSAPYDTSSTLTLTTNGASVGTESVTITGTGGGLSRTAAVELAVAVPQPTTLEINPSEGYVGAYTVTMTVGNGANMSLDLCYTLNGRAERTFSIALDANGQWSLPQSRYASTGVYVFTGMKNALLSEWVPIHVTHTSKAPQPVTMSLNPPSLSPPRDYTMTVGNGAGMTDALGTVDYTYDTMDRLTREARTLTGLTGTFTTGYGYDRKGNLTQLTYPSGRVVDYNYAMGGGCCNSRLDSVMDQTTDTTLLSARTYQAFGGTLTQTLGNGATQSFAYNSRLQLTRITAAAGGHTVMDFSYGYVSIDENGVTTDENTGRVRSRTDAVQPEHSATYTYDSIYRLKQVQGAGQSWGVSWTFDTWGNRRTQTPSGLATSKVGTQTLGYTSTTNRNTAFMYDAAGNQKTDGTHNYTFNAANQITQMDAGAAVYTYDGDGRRMKKTVGTETIYYFYAMGVLVSEFSTTNTGATGAASTDRTTYQTSDKLGTAVLLMAASGLVIENNRTLPYGEEWLPATGSANEQKFTSYQRDAESGLDYALNRYASTRNGRFQSVDQGPYRLSAPSSLNRYIMTLADPLNYTDPDGQLAISIFGPLRWLGRQVATLLTGQDEPVGPQECPFPDRNEFIGGIFNDGLTGYNDLSPEQKVVFQNISVAAAAAGLKLGDAGLTPESIGDGRIHFSATFGVALRGQIQNLDTFKKSGGLERRVIQGFGLHPGENDFLARENRRRNSLQFGAGDDGAFLDIDGFNSLFDAGSFFGHIFWNNVDQNRFLEKRGYDQCFEDSSTEPGGQ